MQMTFFERSEFVSIGVVEGEGLAFRFLAMNEDGRIEILHEKVDGEWQVVTGPAPFFLRALVSVKAADERWRHGEGPAVADLRAQP